MIVRISTEDQYRLPDDEREQLNELDNQAVAAVEAGDEDRFHEIFESMLDLVRHGERLTDDELEGSAVILPPPDISFIEAQGEFTGDGLIPD